MKCIIQCFQPLRNKSQVITINNGKIYFNDGRYERVILSNYDEVDEFFVKLCKIIFSWKQEYIGDRVYDGEKYLIEFDINHKRRKYKIQNKFPDNWDEFLGIKEEILSFDEE